MKNAGIKKQLARNRRHVRVRAKIHGTATRPRLSVFRSLQHVFVQLIDDERSITLASAKDTEVKDGKLSKTEVATKVGELIAAKAKKLSITTVVFDAGGYRYHGRVKAIADGARQGGLIF